MSWSKYVSIFCDGSDCQEVYDTLASTVSEARRVYLPDEWVYRDGKDFCPECA